MVGCGVCGEIFGHLIGCSFNPAKEKLCRYGQTVVTLHGADNFSSITMHDWSAPSGEILNPSRLFASKRLLVSED